MYRTPRAKRSSSSTGTPISGMEAPQNQKNIHGKQFIECFYAYHSGAESAIGEVGKGEVRKI